MRQAFQDVIEFERLAGHPLSEGLPDIPDDRTRRLRMRLILEECDELMTGMTEGNLPEIADGLADLIFVCLGTAVRFGIDLPAVWDEVASANLAKFGPGSTRRADGKVEKPAEWEHPDIEWTLACQAPLGSIYLGKQGNLPSVYESSSGTPGFILADRECGLVFAGCTSEPKKAPSVASSASTRIGSVLDRVSNWIALKRS
jgi:predicted HAD superfamily Cof-like phosphohydrolase